MSNSYTKLRAACAALAAAAALSACGVSNELRVTSVSCLTGVGEVSVAGLQSAVSNGCPWVSLAFSDGLGDDALWTGGFQWRYDFGPVALHVFDETRNYQLFAGAHFWRPICNSNQVYSTPAEYLPSFSLGDGSGYMIVSNIEDRAVYRRVYASRRDGVFTYRDFYAPHWIVWTTNAGASYEAGWPWVNVQIGTNDTYTFEGMPIRWAVATRARELKREDDFSLLPGIKGELPPFFIALTETTEKTVTAVISNGVDMGLCQAESFAPAAGRGSNYPETGRTLAEVLALCNLATALHNAVTDDALTPAYASAGSAFYVPVSNVADVVFNAHATGYRLPTQREFELAGAGDNRNVYPWGNNQSFEWFYETNGLPVTETVLYSTQEQRDFALKYHRATTNSMANFTSRNGRRHVSPGRVAEVRSQFRAWSIPAVNTNGVPVLWEMAGFGGAVYFGDSTSDGAWGAGTAQVHDMAGNVSEMTWPPAVRAWGSVRVCVMGGAPALDAGFARSGVRSWCSATVGRSTVGWRFARNKLEVE